MTAAAVTRTDPHRLAVLDPAEYRLVALLDSHEEEGSYEALDPEFADPEQLLANLDGRPKECRICGQSHGNRYWAFFLHEPTGSVIQVGSLCGSKVGLASRSALEVVRAHEGRKLAVERGRFLARTPGARRAIEWAQGRMDHYGLPLRADGACHVLSGGVKDIPQWDDFATGFARDLVSRLNRYAEISDKQIALALLLQAVQPEREARAAEQEAKRAAEKAAERPIPEDLKGKRALLTGTLLSVQWRDNNFGGAFKVLLRDDRGFKVWGTATDAILDAAFGQVAEDYSTEYGSRGAHVADHVRKGTEVRVFFTAKVEASDDDPAFGFFSRPTKAGAAR